jgi:glucose-6-phosphate isomerase
MDYASRKTSAQTSLGTLQCNREHPIWICIGNAYWADDQFGLLVYSGIGTSHLTARAASWALAAAKALQILRWPFDTSGRTG